MFIENQEDFGSKNHSASYSSMFMQINRRFIIKCFNHLREFGINPRQIPILRLIADKEGLSQREIAEMLEITPPTVNVTIQRLEKSGFLYRKADEADQRISRIYLTEKGHQAKDYGMQEVAEYERIMLDGFSDVELCLLRRFLEQIADNIDKIPNHSEKNILGKEADKHD